MYIRQMKWINNWDLVDISAPYIIGNYLLKEMKKIEEKKNSKKESDPCEILYSWAKSYVLWERRVSIISTFEFIRDNRFAPTMKIS